MPPRHPNETQDPSSGTKPGPTAKTRPTTRPGPCQYHPPVSDFRLAAETIVRTLQAKGHIAYFAGGCVRDELLGRDPDDYDVATDAPPQAILKLFPGSSVVGSAFGVMLVKGQLGQSTRWEIIEVATFRTDGEYTDRRRPDSIRFATPEEDARRRDYTVNALYLNPFAPPSEQVIDFVGGRADLEKRVLRAVGDPAKRLAEDHLRGLRAARLAAKLDFTIDPDTAQAIRDHASELEGVSRERIGDEVIRMASHPSRVQAAKFLAELGLLKPVFHHDGPGPDKYPILSILPKPATVSCVLAAWALDLQAGGISHPITDGPIDRIADVWRKSLCLSNEHRDGVREALRGLGRLRGEGSRVSWLMEGLAPQKRAAAMRWFGDALMLLEAESPAEAAVIRARLAELSVSFGGISPPPLLTGDHLISMGITPGPRYRKLLETMYDRQLEGVVQTTAEAKVSALELNRELSDTPDV
jgi:poly(A) polymerase